MKKLLLLTLFVFTLFHAYSQIQDNTGISNPFINLSQKEKDNKLDEVCCKNYTDSESKRAQIIIKLLLEAGANPNCKKDGYDTPLLYHAIKRKNYAAVRVLIDGGADLSFVNKYGESFTYFMINEDFPLEEVEYALQKGAPAYGKKAPTREPVIEAIYKKNLDMIKLLEKYGASLKTTNDTNYKSALAYAVSNGNFDIVKYCIEQGCKFSDIPKDEPPPVFNAIRNENFELAEYLIENGDNINKPFLFYWDHYKAYLFHGMFYTVNGYNSHYHIYSDGTIKKALELGADPYLKDENGNNAFQLAVKLLIKGRHSSSNLMELLKYGYKICPNPKYKKSLGEAIACGDIEDVKKILKTYKADTESSKLLQLGLTKDIENKDESMQLLLDAGIKPDYEILTRCLFYRSDDGKYLTKLSRYIDLKKGDNTWKYDFLSYYFKYGNDNDEYLVPKCVNFVLDSGMTLDTMIHCERSDLPEQIPLLFYVAIFDRTRNCSGIQVLIDRGADINQMWNGKRPIDYLKAGQRNHTFLLDHGAKVYN
ncbi:MAG: ankyrin repeat domain-containing protein [Treponema sp.]|uniref:ankyrin repeat domain-containing protein n=1 Tax=Treponema sp. TaxID=166 RepID=UPI00298E888A|nr:ankyrin repeat domain-containing protein [Treponema sp.]MCQ2600388.1 ankyrin repeat domain-containing protein [Treponema sp.]